MRKREAIIIIFLAVVLPLLFLADMCVGGVNISFSEVFAALTGGTIDEQTGIIVRHIRLIKGLVAICAGIGLSLSGLQMQTLFRNPLAGPYVLGISSGASLGVALLILGGSALGLTGGWIQVGIAGAAWIGSAAILLCISLLGSRVRDIMVILILGMMFSSGVSAVVQILQFLSKDDALKSYVIWTMGSLGEVTNTELLILIIAVVVGMMLTVLSVKSLNLLMLGEDYAVTMGMNVRSSRLLIFTSTSLLAGTVTAFCGPIGFIGVALPHVARMLVNNSDHRILMPVTILIGSIVMLICDIISKIFLLPINAITALVGIPVIVSIVLKKQ